MGQRSPASHPRCGQPGAAAAGDTRYERSNEMFERFTEKARRVVVLAQEEARLLNHNYIGTEHILLGLLRETEGVAAEALESLGFTLEAVRERVGQKVGRPARDAHWP